VKRYFNTDQESGCCCSSLNTQDQIWQMLWVMTFVLDTKQYCLKMQPVDEGKDLDLVSYCDSD
jgi:hypothetical protein